MKGTARQAESERLKEKIAQLRAKNRALKTLHETVLAQREQETQEAASREAQYTSLADQYTELQNRYAQLQKTAAELQEKVTLLELLHFGPKSEKVTQEDEKQGRLFNEAEDGAFARDDEQQKATGNIIEIAAHSRRKRKGAGRKKISEDLPREVHVYDLDEAEKICTCGAKKVCIGEDVSERVKVIPARIVVIQERRKKYVCRSCEGTSDGETGVATAEGAVHLIARSIADESLLAWSLSEKFEYGLPFYRQAKRLEYIGIPLPRATLSTLAIRVAVACHPVYEQLRQHILSGPLIHADETRIQVLKEPNRKAQANSWMWVYVGGSAGKQHQQRFSVVFEYSPSRSHEIPYAFLKGYDGWLITDDYEAYATAVRKIHNERLQRGESGTINRALCWAHARRKFIQAWEITKSPEADAVVKIIQELFALEQLREEYDVEEFGTERARRGKEILDRLWQRLETLAGRTPPTLALGKAVRYTVDNWLLLKRYLEDPLLPPSNNIAENKIRPFVVGRKAWLFADTPDGAHASATLYSLVESAKANGLAPYDYLYYIMREIPSCKDPADYARLLPHLLTPEMIKPSAED